MEQIAREARRARIIGYFLPDFIITWNLKAKAQSVSEAYRPQLEEAMKAKNKEAYEDAIAIRNHEASYYLDQSDALETRRLTKRARHQLLEVPNTTNVWEQGDFGERWLSPEAFRKLALEVRAAEYETWKHRRDWIATLLSLAALGVSFWGVANTQKRISAIETRVGSVDQDLHALSARSKVLEEWMMKQADEIRAKEQQQPSRRKGSKSRPTRRARGGR